MLESSSLTHAGFSLQDLFAVGISGAALALSVVSLWLTLSARRSQLHAQIVDDGLVRVTNVGTTPAWHLRVKVSIHDFPEVHPEPTERDDQGRIFVDCGSWSEEFPFLSPGSSIVVELPDSLGKDEVRFPHKIKVQWYRSRFRWLPRSRISTDLYSSGKKMDGFKT